MRQVLANEGSCSLANSMEFIVVACGLEVSCSGTMIGLEYHLPLMRTPVMSRSFAEEVLCRQKMETVPVRHVSWKVCSSEMPKNWFFSAAVMPRMSCSLMRVEVRAGE